MISQSKSNRIYISYSCGQPDDDHVSSKHVADF